MEWTHGEIDGGLGGRDSERATEWRASEQSSERSSEYRVMRALISLWPLGGGKSRGVVRVGGTRRRCRVGSIQAPGAQLGRCQPEAVIVVGLR